MNRLRVLASLAVGLLLSGCAERADIGTPLPGQKMDGSTASAPATSSRQLAARKRAARIEECPTSPRGVASVVGGLPDLTLPCLGGGPDVRLSTLRGRPMVVNVWAQWCRPCRQEAPALAQFAAGADNTVRVLGVDYGDPQPELAVEFARVSNWHYPQLADPDRRLAAPLQIAGPPQTFFVRSDGSIAYRHTGAFTSADQIRRLVRQHLAAA